MFNLLYLLRECVVCFADLLFADLVSLDTRVILDSQNKSFPNYKHEICNRFQAIKGDSAAQSGIHNLPTVLSVGKYNPTHVGTMPHLLEDRGALIMSAVVFAIAGGLGVTAVGYYTPFMIAGSTVMAVGAGLLLLFRVDTPLSMWCVTLTDIIQCSFVDLS